MNPNDYSIPASAAAAALLRNRVDHVVTVPDWVQLALHDRLDKGVGDIKVINCCNENQTVTVAAGLTIGGKRPLLMMQNQGLYNCFNTLRAVWAERFPVLLAMKGPVFVELMVEPVPQQTKDGFEQTELPPNQFYRMGDEALALQAWLAQGAA